MARCTAIGICDNDDCGRCGKRLAEAYRAGSSPPGVIPPGAAPTGHLGGLFAAARLVPKVMPSVGCVSTRNVNQVWPIREGMQNTPDVIYEMEPGSFCVRLVARRKNTNEVIYDIEFPMVMLVKFAKAWAHDTADEFIGNLIRGRKS